MSHPRNLARKRRRTEIRRVIARVEKFLYLRGRTLINVLSPGPAAGFKDTHKLLIVVGNFLYRSFTRSFLIAPVNKRLPKVRTPNCKSDEPWHARRYRQPLSHFLVVLPAAQDDTSHFVPPVAARRGHHRLAILATIEPFDLPDIRLDMRVLEFADRLDHKWWTDFQVVRLLVALHLVELSLLRGYQQLKHETAAIRTLQIIG